MHDNTSLWFRCVQLLLFIHMTEGGTPNPIPEKLLKKSNGTIAVFHGLICNNGVAQCSLNQRHSSL